MALPNHPSQPGERCRPLLMIDSILKYGFLLVLTLGSRQDNDLLENMRTHSMSSGPSARAWDLEKACSHSR